MQALSSSRLTLVCFILGLFLFPNKLDSWDSFQTHPVTAWHTRCLILWIFSKIKESLCRFTQWHDRISDTFTTRTHHEPHRVNE